MATAYKVLGQIEPAATTATTLYTVPSATEAVVSTISACNNGTAATTIRIAVRPDGESLADKHYIVYETAIQSYESLFFTIGITLNASDVITVYAGTATVSFNAFGSEITA